ncbi:hypothetical protein LINPERPRIM_LOCUS1781 [Linum perenne]
MVLCQICSRLGILATTKFNSSWTLITQSHTSSVQRAREPCSCNCLVPHLRATSTRLRGACSFPFRENNHVADYIANRGHSFPFNFYCIEHTDPNFSYLITI